MRPLNLIANPHAAQAEDTAVMIDGEAAVRGIDGQLRIKIIVMDMGDPEFHRQVLQLAVAVRHTHGTDMVTLGKQQFENLPAVIDDPRGIGYDHHILAGKGDAGGEQLGNTLHLDNTQAAGSALRQAIKMTEGRNGYVVLPGNFKNGFILAGTDIPIVYLKCQQARGIQVGSEFPMRVMAHDTSLPGMQASAKHFLS